MRRAALVASLLTCSAIARADAPKTKELTGKAIPAGIKSLDTVEKALSWTDGNGAMVAIFSTKQVYDDDIKSFYLQVDLAVVGAGKPRILRTVKDNVEQCGEDVTAEFVPAATSVTDLDGDGKAELTFAYRVSCKGDVSPDTIKVLVLEDKDKYILRGDDTFEPEPGKRQGGAFKPDPAAATWPAAFLEHATQTWKRVVSK